MASCGMPAFSKSRAACFAWENSSNKPITVFISLSFLGRLLGRWYRPNSITSRGRVRDQAVLPLVWRVHPLYMDLFTAQGHLLWLADGSLLAANMHFFFKHQALFHYEDLFQQGNNEGVPLVANAGGWPAPYLMHGHMLHHDFFSHERLINGFLTLGNGFKDARASGLHRTLLHAQLFPEDW